MFISQAQIWWFICASICLFDFWQFSKLIIWKPDSVCEAGIVFWSFVVWFCFDFSCLLAPSICWLGRGSFSGSFCVNCCSNNSNNSNESNTNSNKSKQVQEMSQAKSKSKPVDAYGLWLVSQHCPSMFIDTHMYICMFICIYWSNSMTERFRILVWKKLTTELSQAPQTPKSQKATL